MQAEKAGVSPHQGDIDPWDLEAARTRDEGPLPRPRLSGVPRSALIALVLTTIARAAGLVLVAESIARGISALLAGGAEAELLRGFALLGALGALIWAGAGWLTSAIAGRVAAEQKLNIRRRLWKGLAAGEQRGGSVAMLASDGVDALDAYYTQTVPALVSAATVPFLIGLRILGTDWVSALIIVLTVPLVPLFMVLIGKHTGQRTDRALRALDRLADHLAELARGLPVIVGLGQARRQALALEDIQREYRSRTEQTLRWAFMSSLALELIATLSVAIVAVFLGLRLLNGTMTLEPALLALILAPECFASLREVGSAFHASQDGLRSLKQVDDVTASGQHSAATTDDPRKHQDAPLGVCDLSVTYGGRTTPALAPTSLQLSGIVALTGPSGCGKSTLLAALVEVLPVTATITGEIVRPASLGVAWSPQSPQFFRRTAAEELEFFGAANPRALLDELGMLTAADARVAELSPGEQRRLAVARALARADAGAQLLVFDEPTAHLDDRAAELVRHAIMRRAEGRTIVFTSHEQATVDIATRVFQMTSTFAPHERQASKEQCTTRATPSDDDGSSDHASHHQKAGQQQAAHSEVTPAASRGSADTQTLAAREAKGPTTLWTMLRGERWSWVWASILGLLAAALGLSLTAVSGWLIVRASVEQYIMYLLVAIVGVRAFGIGRSVARYFEQLASHHAAFGVVDRVRLRLWNAISRRGAGSRRMLEGGSPIDYLVTKAHELRDALPRVIPPIVVGMVAVIGTVLTTFWLLPSATPTVALALMATMGVAAWLVIASSSTNQPRRLQLKRTLTRNTWALNQAGSDIAGNGLATNSITALDVEAQRIAQVERALLWNGATSTAVITAVIASLAAAIPIIAPGASAEFAAVIALLVLALIDPLQRCASAFARVPTTRVVVRELGAVLDDSHPVEWGERASPRPIHSLALDHVTVQYPGAPAPAVSQVSGMASIGRWLVIDGPSGSGKSTILTAMLGMLPTSAGQVRANDVSIRAVQESSWRQTIAWCPQEAHIFSSTIRGNLMLAATSVHRPSDRELHEVLARVGLDALVATLPEGLDQSVGAGGSLLSGGERQRLAVARALLTGADVLLLDEPTAHLDAPTATAMMTDLRRASAEHVVVLVSHRAADREPSDEVLRLDELLREDVRGEAGKVTNALALADEFNR